jgi:hypothetical protein
MIGAIYDFFTLPRQVQEANLKRAMLSPAHVHIHQQNGRTLDISIGGRSGQAQNNPEQAVLRAAKENRGMVSAADVALAANIPLDEARKSLDAMVSKGYAELRVRKTGTIVYAIPEFLDADAPLEDL